MIKVESATYGECRVLAGGLRLLECKNLLAC